MASAHPMIGGSARRGYEVLTAVLFCLLVSGGSVDCETDVVPVRLDSEPGDPWPSLDNLTDVLHLTIFPPDEVKVFEEHLVDVAISWSLNVTLPDVTANSTAVCLVRLTVGTAEDWILQVDNGTVVVDVATEGQWNLTLRGLSLGYAYLQVYAEWVDLTTPCVWDGVPVPLARNDTGYVTAIAQSTIIPTSVAQSTVATTTTTPIPLTTTVDIVPELIPMQKEEVEDDWWNWHDPDHAEPEQATTQAATTTTTTKKLPRSTRKKTPRSDVKPIPTSPPTPQRAVIPEVRADMVEIDNIGVTERSSGSSSGAGVEVLPDAASPLQHSLSVEDDSGNTEAGIGQEAAPRDVAPDHLTNSDKSLEVPANREMPNQPEVPAVVVATTGAPPLPAKSTVRFVEPDRDADPYENIYSEGATYQSFRRRRSADTVAANEELASGTATLMPVGYRVGVMRNARSLDIAFIILITIVVAVNTLMMGCQLDLTVVKGVLKKPIGPVVGFVSQFLFMPLASYGLGVLFFTDHNLQLGLFALGCSPGGNGSNFWTLLLKGDVDLSITMTFVSTICAIFMMPFWLYTLGQSILDRGKIEIPFGNLFMSLLMFTVPLSIGVVIRHFKPTWAAFARKCIRPFTVILLIVMPIIAVVNSRFIFALMTWQTIVAGLCVAWGGYTFGAIFSWLARMKRPQITAVSIETAIQNAGVAFMVLGLTLGQPDADLSSVAPVSQLMVTGLPLFLIYIPIMIRRKCQARSLRKKEEADKKAAADRRDDLDATDPLVINRQHSLARGAAPPVPRLLDDKKGRASEVANGSSAPANQQQQRTLGNGARYTAVNNAEPVYANMYMEYNDTVLNKMYDKPTLVMKESLEDRPIREDDHEFENFRKGRTSQLISDGADDLSLPPPPTPLSSMPPLVEGDLVDDANVANRMDETGFYESIA